MIKKIFTIGLVVGFLALLINPSITNDKVYGQSSVLNHNVKIDTMTFYEAGLNGREGMRIYTYSSGDVNDSTTIVNGDGTMMLSFKPIVQPGGVTDNDTMVVTIGGYGLQLPNRSDTNGAGKLPAGTLFVVNDTLRMTIDGGAAADSSTMVKTTKHY